LNFDGFKATVLITQEKIIEIPKGYNRLSKGNGAQQEHQG
jgi:hypothetical protein